MSTSEHHWAVATETIHGSSALGRNVPRREGAAMLRGHACYVDDLPRRGVWWGGTVRADVPHARVLGLRFDPHFDWRRVVVVTARDIPGENVVPVVLCDQPSLAETTIRYRGEPVALIAAPDAETLHQALDSVRLETAPLAPAFDMDEALSGKVAVFGSDNVFRTIDIRKGDAAAAMASADVVIEGEYYTGAQEHVYLDRLDTMLAG